MFDYMDAGKMEGVSFRLMTFTQQQMANVSTQQEQKQVEAGRNLALRCEVKPTKPSGISHNLSQHTLVTIK